MFDIRYAFSINIYRCCIGNSENWGYEVNEVSSLERAWQQDVGVFLMLIKTCLKYLLYFRNAHGDQLMAGLKGVFLF